MEADADKAQISVSGRWVDVPCYSIGGVRVIVTGRWPRVASVFQEDWLPEPLTHPAEVIAALRTGGTGADYFTFAQSFTDTRPRHPYRHELDNIAAIPIISYQDWWDRRVSSDLRKDIRRSEKRGVVTRVVDFTDALVGGIKKIYDEVPVRQGRPFWHYQKPLETVKNENASFLDRSVFLGAYAGDELIGFIKIVRAAYVARMMQIIALERHADKRPVNALIATAVRWAEQQGFRYLTYGRFTYDGKKNSTIVQFKRRNGFQEILFPRFYVPLRLCGELCVRTGLHRGFRRFVPERLTEMAKAVRLRLARRA